MYCGIVIAVLASLFILIYVIGKKDKKKFDETQALKLQEIKEKEGTPASEIVQTTPEDTSITPITEVAPSVVENSIELPKTAENTEEVVPVINPDDIPATPIEELPKAVPVVNEEVYGYNENEIREVNEVPKFQMEPNIEPVIPENTIEKMRALNNELDAEMNSLEAVATPKVAPVEVISDTLDVNPPAGPNASTMPRTQIFSAVNVPKAPQNDDEIDSL